MPLTSAQIAEAYVDMAARARLPLPHQAGHVAIDAALKMASTLITDDPASEPAAMFYAFARHPRAFPGLVRAMTAIVAMTCARQHGIVLGQKDGDELEAMVFGVTGRSVPFERVLAFFRQRIAEA